MIYIFEFFFSFSILRICGFLHLFRYYIKIFIYNLSKFHRFYLILIVITITSIPIWILTKCTRCNYVSFIKIRWLKFLVLVLDSFILKDIPFCTLLYGIHLCSWLESILFILWLASYYDFIRSLAITINNYYLIETSITVIWSSIPLTGVCLFHKFLFLLKFIHSRLIGTNILI